MRLFLACDIPEELRKGLVGLQKMIGTDHARIKWVEPENIHLTLKFLGEVDEGKLGAIKDALGKLKSGPIPCSFSGIGVFPSESYIRVLWIGISPEDKIATLHNHVEDALSGQGFRPDPRFRSHVTIGRVKSVSDKSEFLGQVIKTKETGMEGIGLGSKFNIDSFVLRQSTLTPNGPIYDDLEVFNLGP